MSAVALVSSNLATVFVESLLFGTFMLLSGLSIYLVVQRERRLALRLRSPQLVQNPMFLSSIAMTVSVTAHWILTVYRAFMAFIYFENGAIPIAYYANLSDPTEIVKTAFMVTALMTFDSVMIYRLWIIWDRNNYIIVFSSCSFLGSVACSIGVVYQFTQYQLGEDIFVSSLGRWIASAASLTLCTNLSSSALIAWKLWRAHERVRSQESNLLWVLAILVESAAIYVGWTVAFLITYATHTNVQFTFIDAWAAMAGIGFMLINVRVGAGWGKHNQRYNPGTARKLTSGQSDSHAAAFRMTPVTVNVNTEVDQEETCVGDSKSMPFRGETSTGDDRSFA